MSDDYWNCWVHFLMLNREKKEIFLSIKELFLCYCSGITLVHWGAGATLSPWRCFFTIPWETELNCMFTSRLLNFPVTRGNESFMALIRGINSPVPVISSPSTANQQSDIEINLQSDLACLHYHHCSLIMFFTARIVVYFIFICKGGWAMPSCGIKKTPEATSP